MKICVLGNQARAVFLFWKVLMRQMLAAGHAVFCLLPDGDPATEQSLRELGVRRLVHEYYAFQKARDKSPLTG